MVYVDVVVQVAFRSVARSGGLKRIGVTCFVTVEKLFKSVGLPLRVILQVGF